MYLPVYKRGMLIATVEDRRACILGRIAFPDERFDGRIGRRAIRDIILFIYDGKTFLKNPPVSLPE